MRLKKGAKIFSRAVSCVFATGMFVTGMFVSGAASAGANCPEIPKEKWMHALDLQKRIVNEYGFAIKKFQTSGNCYEIYGWALNEKGDEFVKVEVYFNPANGDIVKKEIDD